MLALSVSCFFGGSCEAAFLLDDNHLGELLFLEEGSLLVVCGCFPGFLLGDSLVAIPVFGPEAGDDSLVVGLALTDSGLVGPFSFLCCLSCPEPASLALVGFTGETLASIGSFLPHGLNLGLGL